MNKIIFFLALILIVSSTACKNDPCDGRIEQRIGTMVEPSIPYEDQNIVRFENSLGAEIQTTVSRELIEWRPDIPKACEDVLEIYLNTSGGVSPYFAEILSRGSLEPDIIQISIFDSEVEGPSIRFHAHEDGSLEIENVGSGTAQHLSSININGKTYLEVTEFNYPMETNKWMKRFLYNKTDGIIYLETYEGYWLQKKE